MRAIITLSVCTLLVSISFGQDKKPNVILIMGDDMGFSDLGCYGSEVETPNLDNLAENGVRFRQFYNMAKCAPSRASLITGQVIGNKKAVSIAEVMNRGGYRTIMCGKQHTEDWMDDHTYVQNSFQRSIYHKGNEFLVPKGGKMNSPFYVNGKKVKVQNLKMKDPLFYKPDVMTDYALDWMTEAKKEDKPIFLYLAYHVAHYPLQARPEDIDKYKSVYDAGWDEIREKRFEKMRREGVVTDNHRLTTPLDNINPFFPNTNNERKKNIPKYRPWESLSKKEKKELSLEMAVYSAMIDRMDQNIGRLIQWLEENGELDNTLIMYLSDNGASPYDANHGFDCEPGGPNSFRSLSAAWANVANTPFKYYKQFGHEGGSNTHFIAHWPDKIMHDEIIDGPGHISDLFPTILDAAGLEYPERMHKENTLPLAGTSLLPLLEEGSRVQPPFLYSGHQKRMRSYREGDWKIVKAMNGPWELYNMRDDPSETHDLAQEDPEKVAQLESALNEVEKRYDNFKSRKH